MARPRSENQKRYGRDRVDARRYRVDAVDGAPVPPRELENKSRHRRRAAEDDVFRVRARDPEDNAARTLLLASDDKDLIVELMKPQSARKQRR